MKNKLLVLLVFSLLSSCASTKRLIYFSNLDKATDYSKEIKNKTDAKIQPDDLLSITVSSLNPESNILFNSGVLQSVGSSSGAGASSGRTNEGYLVDRVGDINFPVLGKIHLAGLTKEQANDLLTAKIEKSVKNPIINIKILNFRITVLGEVNRPSTFAVLSERVNLLDAIGLAGDLTVYGRRDNILVIREKDGIRSTARINLSSTDALESPIYYLQQNDIVYVEPVKVRALQSGSSGFYLTLVTLGISLITTLVFLLR